MRKLSHSYGPLAGSWCGDAIFAVGDDYGKPDDFGVKTSTEQNPERNLNQMAKEEFEDVSYKAIAMLCEGREGFAVEMTKRIRDTGDSELLMHLGNVVFTVGCDKLGDELVKEFGKDWVDLYKQAWKDQFAVRPKLANKL